MSISHLSFLFAPQGNSTSGKRSIFAQEIAAKRASEARVPPVREVVSTLDPPERKLGLKRVGLSLFVIHNHRVTLGICLPSVKYESTFKWHLSHLKRKLSFFPLTVLSTAGLGLHLGLRCRENAGHYLTLGERKETEVSCRDCKIKM